MEKQSKKVTEQILKEIIKSTRLNCKMNDENTKRFINILKHSSAYGNIYLNADKYFFKVANYTIANGKRVRMIFACLKYNEQCMPISKTKLLDSIYGKKKKTEQQKIASYISDVKAAARNEIDYQIREYRETVELPIRCPLSGRKLTNWSNIHVDHKDPFIDLFMDWLDMLGINPIDIVLDGPATNRRFRSEELKQSWRNYHNDNAILQAVSRKANLRKGASRD